MAKAKKESRPKRNRKNLVKSLKRIKKNEELIKKFKNETH
jgi:hypothetical protein